MDFDDFVSQAWSDHADDSPAVATRLQGQALALVTEPAQVPRLAHLAHHVFGEHLARWADGLSFLQQLAALPACSSQADVAQGVRRHVASLQLAAGQPDPRAGFDISERIRITALAAADLASHDAQRASAFLEEALAQSDQAVLPATDLSHRVLAVTGNGIAGTLEEKPQRSELERRLMIRAAQVARRHWELAGTWLETERAEYRLARTWQQAGDLTQARQHAQNCLEIVQAHDNVPLEAFFGWEALGLVEHSAGNAAGHAQAVRNAQAAFEALSADDQGWCRPSLDKLASAR
jgi:hypothetical protein